jgi:hypothetical protein
VRKGSLYLFHPNIRWKLSKDTLHLLSISVHGQNVSATKHIGTKNIGPKRIAYRTYRLQNVSVTKRIGGQNVLATKRIGGQNESATKRIGGQNVSTDKTYRQIIEKLELIFNIFFLNFKGTPSQVEHQTVFRSQSRTGTWTWTWARTGIQTRTWAQTHGHEHGHEHFDKLILLYLGKCQFYFVLFLIS